MATKRKPNKRTQANEWPKVTTCLTFNDRAEEAVRFYVSAFKDSEILSMVRSEADGPIPKGKLLNATFRLQGTVYTAFDGGPSFAFSQGTSIMVECGTQSEIDRLWETLSLATRQEIVDELTSFVEEVLAQRQLHVGTSDNYMCASRLDR